MFLSYFFIFILCHMLFLWFPFSSLLYLILTHEIFFSFSSISLLSIRFYFTSSWYLGISSLSFYISVLWWFLILLGFPSGSDSKESAFSVGDLGSFPLLGRSPGEGNGYQLQYFCLENSMDREASVELQIHGVAELDMAEQLSLLLIPLICFTSFKNLF